MNLSKESFQNSLEKHLVQTLYRSPSSPLSCSSALKYSVLE